MQGPRFILFFSVITIIIFLIDLYVIINWKKTAKLKNLSKKYWDIPLIISIVLSCLSLFNSIDRMIYHNLSIQTSNKLLIITTIWFIPKIFIFPILILKDIIKLFNIVISKVRNKKELIPHIIDGDNLSNKGLSRREVIQNVGWSFASVPFFMVGYGTLYVNKKLNPIYINYKLANLPGSFNNFKIIQITDLHLGSLTSESILYDIIFAIKFHMPDLVLITGDFVNSNPLEMTPYTHLISQMKGKLGTLGCLGNHDHYMTDDEHFTLLNMIKESEVELLNNTNKKIYIGNEFINISGVDNWGMRQQFGDFGKVANETDFSVTSILMCHDPNNWRRFIIDKIPYDITLSGHTHGGQIGFETERFNLMPVSLVYEFYAGAYQIGNQNLYVNRGIGTTGPPIRLGVEPEITIISLQNDDSLT